MEQEQAIEIIKMEIGVDVATKRTGFAAIINGELKYYGTIETNEALNFSGEKMTKDITIINRNIYGFVGSLKKQLDENKTYQLDCVVAIENSQHKNISLLWKLASYVGIYANSIVNSLQLLFPLNKIELKLTNPREWQLRIFNKVLEREEGKLKSIEAAKESWNVEVDNDTADAINLATLAREIRDNRVVKDDKKEREKRKISDKEKILSINIKLNLLLKELMEKQHQMYLKNGKFENIPLVAFANKQQVMRLVKYKTQLEELKADLKIINKFHIIKNREDLN